MKQLFQAGFLMLAGFVFVASAQDWYHDRDARFQGEEWRGQLFEHVRTDLDHIGSAVWASGKERNRLDKTKGQLVELQGKMGHGRYDEHELNDVVDSLRKSANDRRLSSQDRDVLNDDLARMRDYREHHDHWGH